MEQQYKAILIAEKSSGAVCISLVDQYHLGAVPKNRKTFSTISDDDVQTGIARAHQQLGSECPEYQNLEIIFNRRFSARRRFIVEEVNELSEPWVKSFTFKQRQRKKQEVSSEVVITA